MSNKDYMEILFKHKEGIPEYAQLDTDGEGYHALEILTQNPDFIPFVGLAVGEYVEFMDSWKSYYVKDKDVPFDSDESIFGRLIRDENTKNLLLAIHSHYYNDTDGFVPITQYYLPFYNPKAKHFQQTADHEISQSINVNSSYDVEFVLTAAADHDNDKPYRAFLYRHVETGGMGAYSMADCMEDLDDLLEDTAFFLRKEDNESSEAKSEKQALEDAWHKYHPDIKISDDCDELLIPFIRSDAYPEMLNFDAYVVRDLLTMLVSVRVINLEEEIVKKENFHG